MDVSDTAANLYVFRSHCSKDKKRIDKQKDPNHWRFQPIFEFMRDKFPHN